MPGKRDQSEDVIKRLAGRGEETLHKLADLPGGSKALKAFNDLRGRVDEMGKKVRGVEQLEARIEKLEREVASLKRTRKAAAPKAPAKKPPPSKA
jgi:phage shock protein A